MRQSIFMSVCLASAVFLTGCQKASDAQVSRAIQDVNVIDSTNLNDIMLTVADPNEAVAYFQKSLRQDPERVEFQRGLAKSLIRARRPQEAAVAWNTLIAGGQATTDDRVDYADALIRIGQWDKAEAALDAVPPTVETYKRYRLEAMVADSNQEWGNADSFMKQRSVLQRAPLAC